MSALKAFANRILRKHSKQSDQDAAKSSPVEDPIATLLSAMGKMKGSVTPETSAVIELTKVILPAIVKKDGDGRKFDEKVAKQFAFACGEMIGMIAGSILAPSKIDGAITEVMNKARIAAKAVAGAEDPDLAKFTKAEKSFGGKSDLSPRATKMTFIADLERQAETEAEPAARAALKLMADQLRNEVNMVDTNPSLERKGSA